MLQLPLFSVQPIGQRPENLNLVGLQFGKGRVRAWRSRKEVWIEYSQEIFKCCKHGTCRAVDGAALPISQGSVDVVPIQPLSCDVKVKISDEFIGLPAGTHVLPRPTARNDIDQDLSLGLEEAGMACPLHVSAVIGAGHFCDVSIIDRARDAQIRMIVLGR